MKIVFFGDSITDANRDRTGEHFLLKYGAGYVNQIAGRLFFEDPLKYEVVNRGISGNRIVDLYARIKADVWNEQPDVLSILCGVNDVWHELDHQNGVDPERFENVYRMLIKDTLERLPNVKIILVEPYVLCGLATKTRLEQFNESRNYAKIVKKLADEYKLYFLPLQDTMDDLYERYGEDVHMLDGIHPNVSGASVIAEKWIEFYKTNIEK